MLVEPELPKWESGQKRRFPEDFRRLAVAYYESLPEDGSKGAYLRRVGDLLLVDVPMAPSDPWRRRIDCATQTNRSSPPQECRARRPRRQARR